MRHSGANADEHVKSESQMLSTTLDCVQLFSTSIIITALNGCVSCGSPAVCVSPVSQ